MKKALAINGFVLFAGVVIMVAIRLWLNYQARPKPELESETDTLQLDDGDLELDNTLNFKDKVLLKIKSLIPSKKNTKLKTEEPALEGLDWTKIVTFAHLIGKRSINYIFIQKAIDLY